MNLQDRYLNMSNSSRVRVAFEEPPETNESTQSIKEETKDVKKKKKFSGFSFSSFKTSTNTSTTVENTTENNTENRQTTTENNMNDDDDILVFSYPLSKKRQYKMSASDLVFIQTPRSAINFTDISVSEARQR